MKKNAANNQAILPAQHAKKKERTVGAMRKSLGGMGIDTSAAEARARSVSRGRKRSRSEAAADVDMEQGEKKRVHSSKSRWGHGGCRAAALPCCGCLQEVLGTWSTCCCCCC